MAVHNHYKRLSHETKNSKDIELSKSIYVSWSTIVENFISSNISKNFNVPFTMADATTLTEAGYVGEDVENIILKLLQAQIIMLKKRKG